MTDAVTLHRESTVIDGMNNASLTGDYLQRVRDAGVSAAMVPVSISDPFAVAVERILSLREVVEDCPAATLVESVDDIDAAARDGLVGLILALEDSRQLDKDLRKVRLFHDLGVRRMQLVYTTLNDAGCGAADRADPGLSRFGIDLVREIERRGVLLDLCHAGARTNADAVEVAERPAVWSHTNVRGVFDHPNNLTDEQLDLVAANGGVVGVSGVPFYAGGDGVSLDDVLDHVDHVRRRIGIDHVGIGLAIFENHPPSFYDQFASLPTDVYGEPPWSWPTGIESVDAFPNITAGLVDRGYDDEAVRAVMGGNFLRVLRETWDPA